MTLPHRCRNCRKASRISQIVQNKSGPFLLTFYGTFHAAGSEIGRLLSAGGAQEVADLRPCRMESSIKGQDFSAHLARFIPARMHPGCTLDAPGL